MTNLDLIRRMKAILPTFTQFFETVRMHQRSALSLVLVLLIPQPLANGSVPPLSEQQIIRLHTAYDGRDHREEAFYALLENVTQWTGEISDVPVRLHIDHESLLKDPDSRRGDLHRIRGRIQQRAMIETDLGPVHEWFVRLADGRPIIVYLVLDDPVRFRDGYEIVVHARYYKWMTFTARDGEPRRYAAFVGAWPQRIGPVAAPRGQIELVTLLAPILILLVVFLVLMAMIRRRRHQSRAARPRPWSDEELASLDAAGPLPDDPAEALRELKRRAES